MDAQYWDSILKDLSGCHVLQTWEWGQVKVQNGWSPIPLVWYQGENQYSILDLRSPKEGGVAKIAAAALVLERSLSFGKFFSRPVLYVPKGPLVSDWGNQELQLRVLQGLVDFGRSRGAIFIKIDPDVILGIGYPQLVDAQMDPTGESLVSSLDAKGWVISDEQVQFRNTVCIDLTRSEEQLLAGMKQKTRYNIRLAARRGVAVRVGTRADLGLLYRMYAETAVRDGFVIRDEEYYRSAWGTMMDAGKAEPLLAEVNGEAIAALIIFRFGRKAWYMFGMSRDLHREKMPNHLLQWQAMRRAKAAGYLQYDLWGAPDEFNEDDPLWGVYRFKEGLGGIVVRHVGAWDFPLNPLYYSIYIKVMPRVLGVMRSMGRSRTERELIN